MNRNYLSKLIVAALLISGTSMGLSLSMRPAAAQQQLVAMADPTAMVTLCFRMGPRTTDMDKQSVVNFLTQQGFTQVGFRPNGYECTGMGTCADAMRVMKSQLYVAQLTLSNQMVLAYRFDPLPQNPKELMNKARYANVSEAPGYGSGGYSTGMTGGGGSGAGNGGYQTGNGYGGSQQQQGGYQYGSGQGELGNGQIGSQPGQQYVRTGSNFGNTGGGSGNTGGGFGNTGGGFGNTGGGFGNQNTGYGNQNTGYGNQGTNSPYGNTNPQTMTGYSGGGSTPIWNKTDGTLSRDGQGNPQIWKTTNYSNNGTLDNTGLFPKSGGGSTANPGSTGGGNMGNFGNTGGGNTGNFGNTGGGNTGNFGNTGGGSTANPGNTGGGGSTANPGNNGGNAAGPPAYNPPAYNPNAPKIPDPPADNQNAPRIPNPPNLLDGTVGPPI